MSTNSVIKAIEAYKVKMIQKSWKAAKNIGEKALRDAIHTRRAIGQAHNFTGNLINSIRVVVIASGSFAKHTPEEKVIYRASDRVRAPIWKMMSQDRTATIHRARLNRGEYKFWQNIIESPMGRYTFKGGDYDWGRDDTHYTADVKTGNETSVTLADRLAANIKSSISDGIEIIVLYGTPYAAYVESVRQTTGYNTTKYKTVEAVGQRFEKA